MRKLPSRKLLATLVAGALFIPHTGFTLGLGEIEVSSALNQKLKADIELLSATPEDAENIIIKLASRKEFSRAGLDRPYALNDLRFKSEVIDGVPHIKVSSGSPIREPYLNFLVEIDWPNGHLLREYTVLLDPPVFMTKSSAEISESRPVNSGPVSTGSTAPVVAPMPVVAASSRPSVAAQPVSAQPRVADSRVSNSQSTAPAFIPAPVVQQQAPQQTTINQPAGTYRIKSGDTAWSLADAMRPDRRITVPQMMFAILRANPEAFINENINGLKRGYILRRPDTAQIAAISKAEAQALMNQHRALWRQYLQSQAGGQPVSAMQAASAATGSGGGQTGATDAHLAIVSAGKGASTTSSKDPSNMTAEELRAELVLARERVETERVEKEALQSRIKSLEQHEGQREGLLTVEDEGLSGVQALNASATESGMTDELAAGTEAAEGAVEQADSDGVVAEESAASDVASQAAVEEAAGNGETTDAVFADEVAGQAAEQAADESSTESVAADDVAATPAEAIQPEGEKNTLSEQLKELLNDPKMMAAIGGGLLLIIAMIGLIFKLGKRRKEDADDIEATGDAIDLESVADDIAEEVAEEEIDVESLAGDQVLGNDEAVTDESEIVEDIAISEPSETETSEARDDVIAEADVYLAYGIYQQAEDLLNQAILENPDRNDYRVKLAETHYASKNAEGFSEIAGEIKNRIDSEDSAEWQKVLTMGQELCADDPLFQGTATSHGLGEVGVDSVANFDLDSSEEDVAETLDLEMDNELELPEMETTRDELEEAAALEDDALEGPAEEIEFDLSDTGAVEEAETVEDDFSLDIDASELDIEMKDEGDSVTDEETIDLTDMELGLDDEEPAVGSATDESAEAEIEFDLGGETEEAAEAAEAAEAESTEVESVEAEEEIALDLTEEVEIESLDMDAETPDTAAFDAEELDTESMDAEVLDTEMLDTEALEAETQEISKVDDESAADVATAANDASVDEEDFDLSSLDDVDEISTKLDLARAYLDMGDQEGTRGILEEVLADGNDEQKQEANELLDKLG